MRLYIAQQINKRNQGRIGVCAKVLMSCWLVKMANVSWLEHDNSESTIIPSVYDSFLKNRIGVLSTMINRKLARILRRLGLDEREVIVYIPESVYTPIGLNIRLTRLQPFQPSFNRG
jgi:hypothetical protein